MRCVGCHRTAEPVTVVVTGAAASFAGFEDEEAELAQVAICSPCRARAEGEAAWLRRQFERLISRGFDRDNANGIMTRRVSKYFRDGTLHRYGEIGVA